MTAATWPLLTDPFAPLLPVTEPPDPGVEQLARLNLVGKGIVRPLRRDQKVDFANDSGERAINASIGQILGTRCDSQFSSGELPWRTEFGSLLYLLRQRNNSAALNEQAYKFVVDAVSRWEPRIRVTSVVLRKQSSGAGALDTLSVRLGWKFLSSAMSDNAVLASGQTTVPIL